MINLFVLHIFVVRFYRIVTAHFYVDVLFFCSLAVCFYALASWLVLQVDTLFIQYHTYRLE